MRATPANKKAAAEDNYLCGSFLVRPNTFLNQKSSYLCVLVEGLGFGLLMAIIAITVGTIIGLLLAFAAVSKSKIARKLVQIFVTIFRNTPILILVYITYFGMPTIGINIPKVPSFVITLALYSSAYMEEVFRAGLEAIPKGIIEAGQAIGLS